MRNITIKNVSKSYKGEVILENLSLSIPSGQFFALLGPSGSGKTTLLRLIAGLEKPDSGEIYLGDEDITHTPINKRKINTVFQQYALFPHMNVYDNVAYSLKIKGVSLDIIDQKVKRILSTVSLERQIYRSIQELSGGQQQRVALARGIINEPDVLLLDEPLAALDLKLREKMLVELIDLQSTLGTTFIYVTHDQVEALTVADSMAVMNDGEIEQVGTPVEMYEFPNSSFVAGFVGTTNILEGVVRTDDSGAQFEVKNLGAFKALLPKNKSFAVDGATVLMSLRPEKIEISKRELSGFSNKLQGVAESIIYHGRSTQYNVRLANGKLLHVFEQNEMHFVTPEDTIEYEDAVYLYWQKENAVLLEQ